ncbi:hypothetical protein FGE05_27575 [Pseudomonas sp. ICMP22404]|nr:hypothetical protein FGE05_27575 [Pseudomonas sp. ICMP22404]
MLTGRSSSRAGSLPQGIGGGHESRGHPGTLVGASLLAMTATQAPSTNLPTRNIRTTAAPAPAPRGSSGRCGCAG